MAKFYEQEGFGVATAACGEEAIEKLAQEKFSIVVSDVKMPGMDGFHLARHIREKYPETDVILIPAFGNVQQAVDAMKLGASDYITKPFQPEAIRLVSEKLIEKKRLQQEVRELRIRVQDAQSLENIVSKSPKMAKIFELIRSLAATDSGVMITGETGTGKELVARAILALSTHEPPSTLTPGVARARGSRAAAAFHAGAGRLARRPGRRRRAGCFPHRPGERRPPAAAGRLCRSAQARHARHRQWLARHGHRAHRPAPARRGCLRHRRERLPPRPGIDGAALRACSVAAAPETDAAACRQRAGQRTARLERRRRSRDRAPFADPGGRARGGTRVPVGVGDRRRARACRDLGTPAPGRHHGDSRHRSVRHTQNNLGVALTRAGKTADAIEAYREAVRLHPQYRDAYSNLGAALSDSGLFAEAIAAHRKAVEISPDDTVANFNLGKHANFQQGFDTFVESWQVAWQREAGSTPFVNAPGRVKRYTDARNVTDQALKILRAGPAEGPFFLRLHYMDPHGPYLPPEAYHGYFAGEHAPEPVERSRLPDYQVQRRSPGEAPILDLAHYRAQYDREIRFLDDEIARLLGGVADLGIRPETLLIAFTGYRRQVLAEVALAGPPVPPR